MLHHWLRELHRRMTTANRRARRSRPDRFRPRLNTLEDRTTPATLTFQEGVGGYAATLDTEIASSNPDANLGTATSITVDLDDGGSPSHALLRFNNIFGPGQIPLGSIITSATLQINVNNVTTTTGVISLHRMLVDWSESTATWNTPFGGNGVQLDGTEAVATADGSLPAPQGNTTGFKTIDVTASLQAWSDGASNFGWFFNTTSTDGLDFDSSENATAANRPLLTVNFASPGFGFSAASVNAVEGNTGSTTATITVERGVTTGAASVDFAATAGTATAGTDFTATSGTLNFAAGEASKTFTVTILGDTLLEGRETINLALSNPVGGVLGAPTAATLNILDQDVLLNEVVVDVPGVDNPFEYVELTGTAGLALTNVYLVAVEGDNGDAQSRGTADMVVSLGTATLGANGLLIIKAPSGGFSTPAGTPVVTDAQLATAGGGLENGTITFVLVVSSTALTEGTDFDTNNDGALDLPAGAVVLDAVGWTDGSSSSDRVYGGALTGLPGAATRTLDNQLMTDAAGWYSGLLSPDNPLVYASGNGLPPGAKLTPGAANRAGLYTFSAATVAENVAGGTVTITVNRIGDTSAAETVQFATGNGTATAGQDYTAASGTLTFGPGDSAQTITITVANDAAAEGDETILVTLSNPNGTTIPAAASTVTVTIADDDDVETSFQDGDANNYGVTQTGTVDTTIYAGTPDFGGDSLQLGIDFDDGGFSSWGLIRFENIVGTGPGQIPAGARITGVTIRMYIEDPGDANAHGFHRMLTTWDENSTWNGLVNGLTRDDVESLAVRDATLLNANVDESFQTATGPGLATAVQSWVNGAPNFGWFIHNTTGGGLDLSASEGVIPDRRPQLLVSYIAPAGAGSFEFEEPVFTATEGGTAATITVGRVGGTAGAASVQFATGGGTATAGTDYTTATGTLNFAAGETRKTFTVTIANDTAVEPVETINLTLSGATGGATVGPRATTTLRLKDNDVDPALRLNELVTDPPDRDEPFEFVETIGTAGSAMGNVYFVSMEGDAGIGAGLADQVIDLTSVLQGTNGLSVIKALLGGHTILPGATVVEESRFDTTGGNILEPGTTSFLLIHSPTAVITQGTDYDWNGDGVLELPAGATIIDGVGATDGGAGDIIYAAANLTIGTNNTPGGMTRIRGNTAANDAAAWYFGDLTGASDTLTYNAAAASANLPAGATVTPGNPNFRVGAVPLMQTVIIDDGSSQRSVLRSIQVVFDSVVTFVGPEADAFSLVRTGGLPAGATLNVTTANVSGVTVATLTFSGTETEPITAPGVNPSLVDGLYTLTVRGDKVQNATGFLDGDNNGTPGGNFVSPPDTAAGGPGQLRLFRLFGDATGNGLVDLADLAAFRGTFNASSTDASYLDDLDADGNGVVDLSDLSQFRSRFNVNLFP